MDYFILNNEKIFIEIKDSNIILKKYINGILTNLNENQSKEIMNELKTKDGYNYDSQMLKDLMKSNPSLNSNFEYYNNFLDYIEKIIPEKCKSNFYNNLKTLQIDLNLDVELKNDNEKSSYITSGGYNTKNNKISMNPENINILKTISKDTNDPNTFFWKNFNKDLLHELFHMASSNYDKETEISLCGFDKYPVDNIYDLNRGLTEGMTEVLSCYGIPGTIEIACGYYIEELFINQLSLIVGIEPLIDSYFGNLGNKLLCEKLFEIDNDAVKASSLFVLIDVNYSLHQKNEEQTILGTIQSRLVDYYSKKILSDIENGVSELEIRRSMDAYKKMLVTKEVLNTMQKNPANYPNLDVSIAAYKKLEMKVNNLFKSKVK